MPLTELLDTQIIRSHRRRRIAGVKYRFRLLLKQMLIGSKGSSRKVRAHDPVALRFENMPCVTLPMFSQRALLAKVGPVG
jgi:hypothetical protein